MASLMHLLSLVNPITMVHNQRRFKLNVKEGTLLRNQLYFSGELKLRGVRTSTQQVLQVAVTSLNRGKCCLRACPSSWKVAHLTDSNLQLFMETSVTLFTLQKWLLVNRLQSSLIRVLRSSSPISDNQLSHHFSLKTSSCLKMLVVPTINPKTSAYPKETQWMEIQYGTLQSVRPTPSFQP